MSSNELIKCSECSAIFSVQFGDESSPVMLPCSHVACMKCTKWDIGGGDGVGKGHHKGNARGKAWCPVCKVMKYHEESMCVNWDNNAEGASEEESDADEIRYAYEVIEQQKAILAEQ
eukprot:GHVH01012142.1.p1 GENE.GHVH01012142.1~~GHVH01012142.1.p1  ORF type:complete len:136 (+),score=23.55 GHVH01012142.1:59-409(+)